MKQTIIRTWAVAQIVIGIAIVASTAHYAPPVLEKMREESRRTGENLLEISEALVSVRTSYAETATNLFISTRDMEDVEAKLKDAGEKIGGAGHMFVGQAQKFAKSERHNRDSTIMGFKTPGSETVANIWELLKDMSMGAGTNLCDVGRDLSHVSKSIGKQREVIAEFQNDRHPKVLQAMETSSQTIGHVGEMLSSCESITTLSKSIYILCGVIALLFIGNGVVLFVASTLGGAFSTPDQRLHAA